MDMLRAPEIPANPSVESQKKKKPLKRRRDDAEKRPEKEWRLLRTKMEYIHIHMRMEG